MRKSLKNKACARFFAPLLAAAALALAACDAALIAPDTEQWRFAIEEPRGSVQDAYAQRFKEIIEERTGGAVQVTVYPYGTLGTSDHVTELLRMGTVQFAMASPGHLGTLIPEVQVLLLHFVLSDDPDVNRRVLGDPELRAAFRALYQEKGLDLLSIFSEGWMVWTGNRALRTPADFAGFRMRTMTSPLLLAAYRAYGASPSPLPYGEVYSALQLNMIDGQVNPVFAIQEMSFYEVSSHMIFARHAPFVATAAANRAFIEGLEPERRAMVMEVIAEVDAYVDEVQRAYNAERLDLITERRPGLEIVTELTEAEREAFREASLPVRDMFVRLAGPRGAEILELLLETVARAEAEQEAAAASS